MIARRGHCIALLSGAASLLTALAWTGPTSAEPLALTVAGADARLNVVSMQGRKFETVVRQQFDFSCGAAALATLLTYHYERPISERDVFKAMWETGDQQRIREVGFSLFEMRSFAQSRGLIADGFKLSLDRVSEIGVPGIALIEDNGYRHFVVIKGVTENACSRATRRRACASFPAGVLRAFGTAPFFSFEATFDGPRELQQIEDWRLAPTSPFDRALDRETLQGVALDQTRPSNSGFAISAPIQGFQ